MVTITNREAAEARQALTGLAKIAWPGAVALKIKRMYREVNTAYTDMETLREEALARLGKKREDGQLFINEQGMVSFETIEAAREFTAYLKDLHAATVEIQHTLSEQDVVGKEVVPELLIGLGPLLEEDAE